MSINLLALPHLHSTRTFARRIVRSAVMMQSVRVSTLKTRYSRRVAEQKQRSFVNDLQGELDIENLGRRARAMIQVRGSGNHIQYSLQNRCLYQNMPAKNVLRTIQPVSRIKTKDVSFSTLKFAKNSFVFSLPVVKQEGV